MKQGIYLACMVVLWVGLCQGAWIDLGTCTDLTDKAGDASALEKAIHDTGEGETIFIPAGTLVLNHPVIVKDVFLRLYNAGVSVTTIAPDFRVDNLETAALSFMASARANRSPVWEIGDFTFEADRADQGSSLALID